jgi:hypothetical protein
MNQHLFYNGLHQILALSLALLKVKIFVRVEGIDSQAGVIATLSLWGVIQLLSEDQRHLMRMNERNSFMLFSYFHRALRESLGHKLVVLTAVSIIIIATQSDRLQIEPILFFIIALLGYLLSILSAMATGALESFGSIKQLSFAQILISIINFALFLPMIHNFVSIGYLANVLITNSLLFFLVSYCLVSRQKKVKQFVKGEQKIYFDKSRLYSRVLILESCIYAFDPLIISTLSTGEAAVEYSVTRRIGILMTIIPMATQPFFALNGSESITKRINGSLKFLSVLSAVVFVITSFYLLKFTLGYNSSDIYQLQVGMVILGTASIFCAPHIASKSTDKWIQIRYQILTKLVPFTLVVSSICIALFGAVAAFITGTLYLLTYVWRLNRASK